MNIAIIGCGNMGCSLAKQLSQKNNLFLYDRHIEKADKGYGNACKEIKQALQPAEIVILAVKPQNLKSIADSIGELRKDQILVSILAGTPLQLLKQHFPHARLVRMMPNLPLAYGEGVIGLSGIHEESALTETFEPLGKIYWLPEEKIDALTALTGSGPAFVCALVEAMIDAGIAMGFNQADSRDLVYQMLRGTLALLEGSQAHPGEIKWQIASPQGTTIAGLKRLEELALRGGMINTFLAAYERATTMSNKH